MGKRQLFLRNALASSIAVAMAAVVMVPTAKAYTNAVPPQVGGQIGVTVLGPSFIYASYGPQTNLTAPEFKSIPYPIYLGNELQKADAFPLKVAAVVVKYNDQLKLKTETETQSTFNSLDDVKARARQVLEQCQAQGTLCDAAVSIVPQSNGETVLAINVTPLTLESIEVVAEDGWQDKTLRHLVKAPLGEMVSLEKIKDVLRLVADNPDLVFEPTIEAIPFAHQVKLVINAPEHKVPVHVVGSYSNLEQQAFGDHFYGITGVTKQCFWLGR